ncbi:MAG TPA: hypothetical protein PLW86_16570 [Rhodocyclaceae bacterium]|nr:hypothetical protein [Rhodocyclaceae bacterium]
MHVFYEGMQPDQAQTVEALSRLMHELRQHRQGLLQQHNVDDEAALLNGIRDGRITEHPGYDHYLSARTLASARSVVRAELQALLASITRQSPPETEHGNDADLPVLWPLTLAHAVEEACGECLEAAADVRQDALLLAIDGGVQLEVRMAAPDSYSFTWTWGDVLLRIDTAPQGDDGAAHLHRADGNRQPSPLASAASPEALVATLVRTLAADPLLEQNP